MEINYEKAIIHQCVGNEERDTDVLLPVLDEVAATPLGIWGQRHLHFIREHRKAMFVSLLCARTLNSYLADVEDQAHTLFSRLVNDMAQNEGVTEQLKADNQMKWIALMNNIRSRATEIVNSELIFK